MIQITIDILINLRLVTHSIDRTVIQPPECLFIVCIISKGEMIRISRTVANHVISLHNLCMMSQMTSPVPKCRGGGCLDEDYNQRNEIKKRTRKKEKKKWKENNVIALFIMYSLSWRYFLIFIINWPFKQTYRHNFY